MTKNSSKTLLDWYSKHARDLPWRHQRDPYAIWVSEVMLQQTRIETVIPYYKKWMEKFPDLPSLAEADQDEVLAVWEGLGYYRRVHNLRRTAKIVMDKHAGILPQTEDALMGLPGIGSYTAAAIAAFAYDEQVIALDGNLRRVLSRFFDYERDVRTQAAEKFLIQHALEMMPEGTAVNFNQALMDLGSTICVPTNPLCDRCPLSQNCLALEYGTQRERPVSKNKKPIPHLKVSAGVLERDGKVLIGRRPEGELLGGLWEFPGGTCEDDETLEQCLIREWQEELNLEVQVGQTYGVFTHAYTHFRVTVNAYQCLSAQGELTVREHQEVQWVPMNELSKYPMGKVDREISKRLLELEDL